MIVKNPWARTRWLGNFSASDLRHWTPALRRLLNYDPDLAAQCDNGVFWIDFASLRRYFRSLHLNWTPALFRYRTLAHGHWPKEQGPESDNYNYGLFESSLPSPLHLLSTFSRTQQRGK